MGAPNLQIGKTDQDWFLYVSPFCYGPFSRDQIIHLILTHQVDRTAKLMRGDQNVWHSILDCVNEITAPNLAVNLDAKGAAERRVAAPRVQVNGIIQAANDKTTVVGHSQDISVTGLFIQTKMTRLRLGDQVTLYVKIAAEDKIAAKATVVRHNACSRFPVGYGLRFVEIGNQAINVISRLVGVRSITEFGDVVTQMDRLPKQFPSDESE